MRPIIERTGEIVGMMDPKRRGIIFLMAAALFAAACSASSVRSEGEAERPAAAGEENRAGDGTAASEESREFFKAETKGPGADTETGKSQPQGDDDTRSGERAEYVGILGHVKEMRDGRVLVASDTDEFPGVFWILGAANPEEFRGGDSVFVLMEDTGQTAEDKIAEYRAGQMYQITEEDGPKARPDVLLTSAPALEFSDVLSSVWDPFVVKPGSYSWDTGKEAVVACGAAPLDGAYADSAPRLKVPGYNGMDRVMYSCSAVFEPDKMTVRQWDSGDAGSTDAVEERLTVYYQVPFCVGLEKGKIYEFSLEWKKENLQDNGFWGTAEYVFVTE